MYTFSKFGYLIKNYDNMRWSLANRTSSTPISVLRYDVDKGLNFVLEFNINLFLGIPNKSRMRELTNLFWCFDLFKHLYMHLYNYIFLTFESAILALYLMGPSVVKSLIGLAPDRKNGI